MHIRVNCNVLPRAPRGFSLEGWDVHRKMGKIMLKRGSSGKLYSNDVELVRRYSSLDERYELREREKHVNACVLDALLAHPKFIPEEWKGTTTYFLGTIFRSESSGTASVEGLYYDGRIWVYAIVPLDSHEHDNTPQLTHRSLFAITRGRICDFVPGSSSYING